MNKKAAEMTIGTIIIIVLALIVLVVLVVGFTGGWSNLWGKITAFFGGGTNVDTIVQACELACTTKAKYDYCDKIRTLKFEDAEKKLRKVDLSCNTLEENKGKTAKDTDNNDAKLPSIELSCEITCPPAGAVAKTCKGTPTACTGIFQTECTKQKGCELVNNACSGTAKACSDSDVSSEANCPKQTGCEWK